ncbi:MAG: GDSL-type esterase/lipase family protein, partial [Candidatus Omnitrophota bacterium]
ILKTDDLGEKEMKRFASIPGMICLNALVILILLEIGLRISGWVFLVLQHQNNQFRLKSNGHVVIMCIGESTTALGGDHSYPSQLSEILKQTFPSKDIVVINKGIPGQNSSYILKYMEQWLDEYDPDMVLVMMGINDEVTTLIPFQDDGSLNIFQKTLRQLRLTKLFLWLKSALIERLTARTPSASDDIQIRRQQIAKNLALYFKAIEYQKNGQIGQSIRLYTYLLAERDPEVLRHDIEIRLIRLLEEEGNYDALVRLMPFISHYKWKTGWLDQVCRSDQGAELVKDRISSVTSKKPNETALYNYLSHCYQVLGKDQEAEQYREHARVLRSRYYSPDEKKNYINLIKMLKKRNVIGIYIQYPLMDITPLKMMVNEYISDDSIFIENKVNFEEALREYGYDRIFYDRFAGDFGHCTELGNRILAESIADRTGEILEKMQRPPSHPVIEK